MATETRETIYKIRLDANEAIQQASVLAARMEDIRGKMKAEAQQNGKSSVAYQQLAAQLKVLSAQYNAYMKYASNSIKLTGQEQASLNALRTELSLVTQQYDALGDAEENAARKQALGDKIVALTKTLNEQEQALGNYRRNVGNYKGAFNGLNVEMQYLVRELPSLSMGFNQFFLAISNNLPMFVDKVKQAKQSVEELKASGQSVPSVGKQIAKSLISWNSLLVVGITLLSAYGKDIINWAKSLITGSDAARTAAEATMEFNEALDTKSLGADIAKFTMLADAYSRINDEAGKVEFLERHNDELHSMGLALDNINEANDLFLDKKDEYLQYLRLRATLKAAESVLSEQMAEGIKKQVEAESKLAKAQEAEAKMNELLEAPINSRGNWTQIGYQFVKYEKLMGDYTRKARKANEDLSKETFAPYLSAIQDTSAKMKEVMDELSFAFDDATSGAGDATQKVEDYTSSLAALTDQMIQTINSGNREGEIILLTRQYGQAIDELEEMEKKAAEIDFSGMSAEEAAKAKATYEEFAANILMYRDRLADNLAAGIAEINQKYDRAEFEVTAALYRRRILEARDNASERLRIELQLLEEEKELLERHEQDTIEVEERIAQKRDEIYRTELKALRDYYKKAAGIAEDGSLAQMQAILQGLNAEIKMRKENGEDTWQLEQERAQKWHDFSRLLFMAGYEEDDTNFVTRFKSRKKMLEGLRKWWAKTPEEEKKIQEEENENLEEYFNNIAKRIDLFGSAIGGIFDGIASLTSARVERQVQELESFYEKANANLEGMYERGAFTEAEYQAESAQLEKEKAEAIAQARKKEAAAERASAIYSIVLDTAKGIMNIWSIWAGFPATAGILTGLLTATAALQTAAVLSEPLPTAARGRYITGKSHTAGGEIIEAEGGEVIINKRSTAMFLPLLSAINEAGGGVPFAAAGYDGGYVARHSGGASYADIVKDIADAMQEVQIVATIQDIKRQEANYVRIQSNGKI
jgi:hypothetical protein